MIRKEEINSMNIGFYLEGILENKELLNNSNLEEGVIKKILQKNLVPNFDKVSKQLQKEGNNLYLIIPQNIKNSNDKFIISIVKKYMAARGIKFQDVITDNNIEEIVKNKNINLVVCTENDNIDEIKKYSKVLIVNEKDTKTKYDNLNIYGIDDFSKLYSEIKMIRENYTSMITPLFGLPSVDKKHFGYYSKLQNNIKVPEETIFEYLCRNNENNKNRKVIDYFGKKLTFNQFEKQIEKCAKSYKHAGLKKGDKITICMPNTPEGLIAFYAAQKLGLVANMIHPLSSEHEILDYVNEVESKVIICLDQCVEKINKIKDATHLNKVVYVSPSNSMPKHMKTAYDLFLNKTKKIVSDDLVESWNEFLSHSKNVDYTEDAKYEKNQLAVILHTGGTSGKSKGVELTNESFNTCVEQLRISIPSYKEGDSLLAVTPIFHGFGLANCIHTPLCVGMSVTLLPQFQLKSFIKTMLRTKANLILGVPTLWKALTKNNLLKNKDLSFLKVIISGGDKLTEKDEEEINLFLQQHSAPNKIYKGYGLTESLAAVSFTCDNANDKTTIGIPLPGNVFKIVDPETNEELSYNEEGEICVSGPTVMQGYHNNPEETNSSLKKHKDGKVWLHTGDIGYINEKGQLYYTQRLKRLIISSGYNVYPSQIEDVINKHNAVESCIVVGVPHEYKVEVPKAYVVLKDEYKTQNIKIEKEILELCKINLSKMAYPKEIAFIKEMPRTSIGKIDYRKLQLENYTNEEELNKRTK